jgi:hypothetical protein
MVVLIELGILVLPSCLGRAFPMSRWATLS